jgi:hypothetical protein
MYKKTCQFGRSQLIARLIMPDQLTLFDLEKYNNYDSRQEPPDPDDYPTIEEWERHWNGWEAKYSDLVPFVVAMSPCESVGAQVAENTLTSDTKHRQVLQTTKKSAPQHDTHWIEKYWVERSGNKFWYYRYCWMVGRKKHRRYIGSVNSPTAKRKKQAIEAAIADGCTPQEIEKNHHFMARIKKVKCEF